jgi:hypothetical protein
MITILLIIHGLMAVALLGAITHQALSVAAAGSTSGRRTFFARFRNVNGPAYAGPIVVMFFVTAVLGGLLYPAYRIDVRVLLEDTNSRSANGIFEIKEHLVAVGLGALPAYWLSWRTPLSPEFATTRRYLTWILAFFVWWAFLVGHVLNNFKGLLPH